VPRDPVEGCPVHLPGPGATRSETAGAIAGQAARAVFRQPGKSPVGLFNLTDHLEAVEADALLAIRARWWDRPILTLDVSGLWHICSFDDLVLDFAVEDVFPPG